MLPESCSWLTAFGVLSRLENRLLTARADAFALLRSRIGGSPYSFNKIMVVAQGPEAVKAGEQFQIEVSMAAFDSDRQPIVTVSGAALKETRDGKGIVVGKAIQGDSEIKLRGTIAIFDKSGIPKTLPWEKKIIVVK